MTKYQNSPDFKLRVKKLAALAFLPLADVIDAFEVLADTFEDDKETRISRKQEFEFTFLYTIYLYIHNM